MSVSRTARAAGRGICLNLTAPERPVCAGRTSRLGRFGNSNPLTLVSRRRRIIPPGDRDGSRRADSRRSSQTSRRPIICQQVGFLTFQRPVECVQFCEAPCSNDKDNRPLQTGAFVLPWTGDEGYKKAEVTGGRIALDEVNPRTLESRRHAGLFSAVRCWMRSARSAATTSPVRGRLAVRPGLPRRRADHCRPQCHETDREKRW
jgi:HI0933-like protein